MSAKVMGQMTREPGLRVLLTQTKHEYGGGEMASWLTADIEAALLPGQAARGTTT
mgnify:FL=1